MNRATSVVILALLAGLGTGVTYLVQHTSATRIATEQRLIDSRTLLDMLPSDSYDNQPLEQPLPLENIPLSNSTLLGVTGRRSLASPARCCCAARPWVTPAPSNC